MSVVPVKLLSAPATLKVSPPPMMSAPLFVKLPPPAALVVKLRPAPSWNTPPAVIVGEVRQRIGVGVADDLELAPVRMISAALLTTLALSNGRCRR